tara:strand:+ start:2022 stop:3914 length:1893 start_codon:yes stop_codon:yes gene_type:complete
MLSLLVSTTSVTTKLPSLDPPCKADGQYVHSSTYGARVSTWGQVTRGGWRGAVLGPDGHTIYGIPTNATTVLEIDAVKRTISTFGDLGTALSSDACAGALHCGVDRWIGGVLAPSTGKIIGIPYAAETVLEIDPATRTATTFGVLSSPVKRKWVEGVLGHNGNVYGIPYDADTVLEINPETHAVQTFGNVGSQPCKWYGGVLAPNKKIYTIPYASQVILQIDPETRSVSIFAVVGDGWAKWAGGVLANNGKIYGVPALSSSVLEIDPAKRTATEFGMLPPTALLEDKWNGGVLAPNGKIYGIPWRSSSVLEFDPETKSISMLGKMKSTNFTWHGGVVIANGRIVAVPYNSANVLEIGERVCMDVADAAGAHSPVMQLQPQPATAAAAARKGKGAAAVQQTPPPVVPQLHFVLALPGCPDDNDGACFNFGHHTWHSVMITLMKPDTSLRAVREQVALSRFEHIPADFCFLFKGHALDPSAEPAVKANQVAVRNEQQLVIFADSTHCTIGPSSLLGTTQSRPHEKAMIGGMIGAAIAVLVAFRVGVHCQRRAQAGYKKVPFDAEALVSEESSRLCWSTRQITTTKKGAKALMKARASPTTTSTATKAAAAPPREAVVGVGVGDGVEMAAGWP